MTLAQVLNVVNNANQVKQWPNEYRIYSPQGFALIYCDKNGQVTSFVTNLNGAVYVLTDAEKKQLQSAIELRMQQLNIKSVYQSKSNTK